MSLNVLARAVLTAVALCVLAVPAIVVLGGYVPSLPVAGRFGSFLVSDLPYVAFLAIVAVGLVGIAVAIGGGRWTKLLGALGLVVVGGVVVAGLALARTLADHGTAYDIPRQLFPVDRSRAPDARFVYATAEGANLHMDAYVPEPSGLATESPPPAVVYVHGGGFVGGELGMRPHLLTSLADRGFVVLDVQYRLAPPPRWHDAPADVLCALAWLGSGAGPLRVDPSRVVLMGESAGGNLALVAGYAAGTDAIEPSCEGAPLVPAGVVAIAPAVDLSALWSNPTLWYDGRPLPEAYVGGRPDELPDRYAAAEPFAYVRGDLPPTLLLAGANDRIIPLDQVQRLERALRDAGAEVSLVVVPFADHGFDGYHNGPGGQLLEHLVPTFVDEVTG